MSSENIQPQRGSRLIGTGVLLTGVAGIIFALSFSSKEFNKTEKLYVPAGQRDFNNGTSVYFIDQDGYRACNAFFPLNEARPSITCATR